MNEQNKKQNEVRKSKYLAKRIPNFQLTKADAETFHFILNKFSKDYWDYETNKLKKDKKLEIVFSLKELTDTFNKNLENEYKNYVVSVEKLIDFKYRIETEKYVRLYSVFPTISYDKKTNKNPKQQIYVKLNNNFVQHLIEVKEDFVKIELEQLGKFKSKYTYRVYDLIKSRSNGRHINIDMTIQKFRKFLMIENMYKTILDLRRKVIEPVARDLETSDLRATIKVWNKRLNKQAGKGVKAEYVYFRNLGDPNQMDIFETKAKPKAQPASETDPKIKKFVNDFFDD